MTANDNKKGQMEAESLTTEKKGKWVILAVMTVIIALVLSPFASGHPDGLERVAEDHGFIEEARTGFAGSLMPDYEVAGVSSDLLKVGLSGLLGIIIIAAVLGLIAFLLRRGGRRVRKDIH
jgi:cobalt/nickel transport protein